MYIYIYIYTCVYIYIYIYRSLTATAPAGRCRVYCAYSYLDGLGQIWPEGHSGCRWVAGDWGAGSSGDRHLAMGAHDSEPEQA